VPLQMPASGYSSACSSGCSSAVCCSSAVQWQCAAKKDDAAGDSSTGGSGLSAMVLRVCSASSDGVDRALASCAVRGGKQAIQR